MNKDKEGAAFCLAVCEAVAWNGIWEGLCTLLIDPARSTNSCLDKVVDTCHRVKAAAPAELSLPPTPKLYNTSN